jgi:gliding motility-associated-like protein
MNLRNKLAFWLLFSLLSSPFLLEAKHIIGGVITYKFIKNTPQGNEYEFTMTVYRDCRGGGASLDNPAQLAIYQGTINNSALKESFTSPLLIDPPVKLIPDTPHCVSNVPDVCVEEGQYKFTRILPVLTNESYFIVYQRCCRNETILNLLKPGNIGATYFIELTPEAMAVGNSSPVFKNFPPIIICNHVPILFDDSAIDPNGDQLVYSFCPPLQGGGNILNGPGLFGCDGAVPTPPCPPPFNVALFVVPAYSASAPMGGNPKITINPITGEITGTPNLLGQFVVTVCVKEFRNGKLLSTVQREFQFNVADCSPTVAAVIDTASVIGGSFQINSCGNKTVTLINKSFKKSNIKHFEWHFDLKGTPFVDSTTWDALKITFPDTGSYTGNLYLNPTMDCGDTASLRVRIFPPVYADFSYSYDTCIAGPVTFKDKSTGEGVIDKWAWDFGVPNAASTIQNPSYLYPIPGDHPVNLRVTDKNLCSADTTEVIHWFPAPPVIIIRPNSFLGCVPGDIFFNNLSSPIDNSYKIVWDFGDGDTLQGVISPHHIYTKPGVYDVSVAITSPLNCFISSKFEHLIRVEPSPIADFTYDPDTLLTNLNNTVHFLDHSTGAAHWNWQIGHYGTSTEVNPTFTFPDTGHVKIRLIVTHKEGCQDSLTKVIDIRPEIRWWMPNAFTPNGDGANEGFLGKGFTYGVTNFKMTIWNRWGELVFETADPQQAWNGRQMNTGGMSPAGVYVYLVSFTGPRGEKNEYKGYSTLIR